MAGRHGEATHASAPWILAACDKYRSSCYPFCATDGCDRFLGFNQVLRRSNKPTRSGEKGKSRMVRSELNFLETEQD